MDYSTQETSAPVREWQYLTGTDFAEMDRENTIVVVSCSPLEVHGPHLPTVTDNIEAEAILLRTIEAYSAKHPDAQFVHLPPVYVAADLVPKPGSLAFRSSTVHRVLEDMGHSLAKQGFKKVWVSNFHGGPRHFIPIETVCAQVSKRYGIEMISLFGLMIRRLSAGSTDIKDLVAEIMNCDVEEVAGDQHGGLVETSIMLHILGAHVAPNFTELDRRTFDGRLAERGERPTSLDGVFNIVRTFREKLRYWHEETYAGNPAMGNAELGEKLLERLAELSAEALTELREGKLEPHELQSPLYRLRHLFLNRPIGWILERSVGFRSQVI